MRPAEDWRALPEKEEKRLGGQAQQDPGPLGQLSQQRVRREEGQADPDDRGDREQRL